MIVLYDAKGGGGGGGGGVRSCVIMTLIFSQIVWMAPYSGQFVLEINKKEALDLSLINASKL